MINRKHSPEKDGPLGSQLRLFKTWQLQVTRLWQRCPKLSKKGFMVRRTDPAQTGFKVQRERPREQEE